MHHLWPKFTIAVVIGAPLLMGAAMPRPNAVPLAPTTHIVEVNFLTRLLDGDQPKRSPRNRSRSTPGRNVVPQPPAIATVPVPIPKPIEQAQGEPGSAEVRELPAPVTEPAPKAATPTAQAEPKPELPGPLAETPVIAEAAKPPVVEQPATSTEPAHVSEVPKPLPKPEKQAADAQPPAQPVAPDQNIGKPVTADAVKPPVVEQPATATEPAHASDVPKPLPKPDKLAVDGQTPAQTTAPDENVTKPGDAKQTESAPDGKEPEKQQAEAPPPPPPPPLVKEDPEELKACIVELTALGAKFEPTDPIDDGDGCGIEHPIDVDDVLPGVDLGGATMRCKTAVTMAHWLKDTVQPAMSIAMPGRKIVGLVPGSTYACRLRNSASTGKISEHARGNAYDVAAFKLDNGEKITMKPRPEDSTMEGAFQRTATAGACLHFTTVLSPGSDAAHKDHLHLDVLERKGGYRYCR